MTQELKGTFRDDDIKLDAWTAKGNFTNAKYTKIVEEFGCELIDKELLTRFHKLTGVKPHRLLRRGLFFAHRQFDQILDDFEAGKPIYLYTGRGPSGKKDSMHLGHIVPIEFTVWLQRVLKAIVVFQIADDEKYWFKNDTWERIYELGKKNTKDIIALGFDPDRTFIFSNRDFSRQACYQKIAFDLMNKVKVNQIKAIFGIQDNCLTGQLMWPIYQTVPAFSQSFGTLFGKQNKVRCLVAYAIDQDPYFLLARDVAPKFDFYKPSSIMCRFLPALEGTSKMSSTSNKGPETSIHLTDTPKQIAKKINKYAFSGGRDTVEEHHKFGGDPDKDIAFQWLKYFMEDDDELERIEREYRSGNMLSGELKKITIGIVTELVLNHQKQRKLVTKELIDQYYDMNNVARHFG